MTRVLVYEWCCSGAAREDSSRAAPLWSEGWAMLAAAATDFSRITEAQVRTILDANLQREPAVMAAVAGWPTGAVIWSNDEPTAFRAAAREADFALVIAPEFDRILELRCRWAVEAGATLLGPSPDAVALTADKLALARHFTINGVPTPETRLVGWVESAERERPNLHYVVKPRFGAGSQAIFLTDSPNLETSRHGEMIVQPFVPGRPASVAFLIGPRQVLVLPPAWQDLADDGRFHYRGGSAPLPAEIADRATRVAQKAIDTVPGLAGYVGVDVILGGERDHVIEINPRLTTSYVGLRALALDNLMDILLRLTRGESVPTPRWRPGSVSWTADGACTLSDP